MRGNASMDLTISPRPLQKQMSLKPVMLSKTIVAALQHSRWSWWPMRQKTCTIIRGIDVDSCLENASSFGSNRFVSSFAFIIGPYILLLRVHICARNLEVKRQDEENVFLEFLVRALILPNFYHLTKWETSHRIVRFSHMLRSFPLFSYSLWVS